MEYKIFTAWFPTELEDFHGFGQPYKRVMISTEDDFNSGRILVYYYDKEKDLTYSLRSAKHNGLVYRIYRTKGSKPEHLIFEFRDLDEAIDSFKGVLFKIVKKLCSFCQNYCWLFDSPISCILYSEGSDEFRELVWNHKDKKDVLPTLCGEYKDIVIEKCELCGKKINKIKREWMYWIVTPDFTYKPVCSQKCSKSYA